MLDGLTIALLPEFILTLGLCVSLVVAVYSPKQHQFNLSFALILLTFLGAAIVSGQMLNQADLWTHKGKIVSNLVTVNSLTQMAKLVLLVTAALILILGYDFLQKQKMNRFEYNLLAGFATLGMMLMMSANDLMTLYIGLEMQSLSLYVLAAFRRDDLRATEAGLKYFVLGALASAILLYGASLIYGFGGTTNFAELAKISNELVTNPALLHTMNYQGLVIGLVFVMAGLAFKISAAPFHMWTPDVYEGVPTPVTAFFAAVPKIAGLVLLTRLLLESFGAISSSWQPMVIALSVLSMTIGAFAGLWQQNLKRLLAYSSIGNIGFMLIGLTSTMVNGVMAMLVYLVIYIIAMIAAFGVIISLRRDGESVESIQDLAGFGYSHRGLALVLLIVMFSLTGIPPLAGFFAKYYILAAGIRAGQLGIVIWAALMSVVSAGYYLRLIKVMYFDKAERSLDQPKLGLAPMVITYGAAFALVMFILAPQLISGPAKHIVLYLMP